MGGAKASLAAFFCVGCNSVGRWPIPASGRFAGADSNLGYFHGAIMRRRDAESILLRDWKTICWLLIANEWTFVAPQEDNV
jgi:hypothetical protein